MEIVKLLSTILLAVYLILSSLASFFGLSYGGGAIGGLLGLCAIGAGVLILLAHKEYHNFPEGK